MNGKRKYTKKISREGQNIARFGHGMSMRACVAKHSVSISMIVNWKKNKSEIISFISKFTSLSLKKICAS
jgi:hypothetical protein